MEPMRRLLLGATVGWLAGACATPSTRQAAIETDIAADTSFEVSGRLSARHGSNGAAASFRWTHRPASDEFLISTPLGQALARLSGSAAVVRLETTDGRSEEAPDWEALTAKVLGAPIPVRGLAWWVRASPRAGSAHSAELDAARRVASLRQDGWEIVYEYDGDAKRPSRLRLRYPDVEIRLVLDSWSDAAAG